MSKVSNADYPTFSGSSVSLGGSKATTGVTNNVLNADYTMSDKESAIYNYALSTLASILPQVNTFDTGTQSSIQSAVDAYQNNGIQDINDIYNPMITSLENDIASRFGNLDNSIFKDNLDDIETKRSDAVSSFAQDILAKKSELESDELTKRYALVNLLSGLANNTYSNALKAISTALGGSTAANSYNSGVYNALSDIASTNTKSNSNWLSTLLGGTGTVTGTSIPSLFNL